jgi:glycosyltransferase involved in cell wall biosynthesis
MANRRSISVVVPTYNRARTIKRCVNSLLKQSLPPDEIIIVDDGSTDNTSSEVANIGDRRVKYLKLAKNAGAQAARNAGIKKASGQFIGFLDSDDEWLPDKLKLQVTELAKRGEDVIVHCPAWKHIEESNERVLFNIPPLDGDAYQALLAAPGPLFPSMLAKRESFFKIGLLDENVPSYQEWDTSIGLAKHFPFAFIDQPLVIYHIHTGEMISKDKLREAKGWQYVVDKHQDEILSNLGKTGLASHYHQIGMFYSEAGKHRQAKEFFYRAFVNEPLNPLRATVAGLSLVGEKAFRLGYQAYLAINRRSGL